MKPTKHWEQLQGLIAATENSDCFELIRLLRNAFRLEQAAEESISDNCDAVHTIYIYVRHSYLGYKDVPIQQD